MKPLHRSPSAVAAIAVATALAALAQAPAAMADDKKPGAAKPSLTVSTVRPQKASLPIRLTANGNVAAWQEAVISSESNGLRLSDVKVNVGDVVNKGEVLAVFAPETPQAEVAQARAALMEAEAAAAEAKANADRARSIETTGALSAQQISQYTTAEATACRPARQRRAGGAGRHRLSERQQGGAPRRGPSLKGDDNAQGHHHGSRRARRPQLQRRRPQRSNPRRRRLHGDADPRHR